VVLPEEDARSKVQGTSLTRGKWAFCISLNALNLSCNVLALHPNESN